MSKTLSPCPVGSSTGLNWHMDWWVTGEIWYLRSRRLSFYIFFSFLGCEFPSNSIACTHLAERRRRSEWWKVVAWVGWPCKGAFYGERTCVSWEKWNGKTGYWVTHWTQTYFEQNIAGGATFDSFNFRFFATFVLSFKLLAKNQPDWVSGRCCHSPIIAISDITKGLV